MANELKRIAGNMYVISVVAQPNDSWTLDLTAPTGDFNIMIECEGKIYVPAQSDGQSIWAYDILTDTWDYTLTGATSDWQFGVSIGTDLFAWRVSASSGQIVKYDTLTDTWDYTLASATTNWRNPQAIGTDVYCMNLNTDAFMKYDTLTDAWDETLNSAPVDVVHTSTDGVDLYATSTLGKVYKYTVSSNSWLALANEVGSFTSWTVWNDGKIYAYVSSLGVPYRYAVYDLTSETWDTTTLSGADTDFEYGVLYEGSIYSHKTTTPFNILEYKI